MDEPRVAFLTDVRICPHCSDPAQWEIYDEVDDPRGSGTSYGIYFCDLCGGIILSELGEAQSAAGDSLAILYPLIKTVPRGTPPRVRKAYLAAQKVRKANPNAYGGMLGRLLDAICDEMGAKQGKLNERLKDLAEKGEIPRKLEAVASSLRDLRNIGAHADLGELTPDELPILDDLTNALLQYLFGLPYLVAQAQKRIQTLKRRKGNRATSRAAGKTSPQKA